VNILPKKHKILHIAPFNVAGVPISFVQAERELEYYSRLITFGRLRHGFQEDICLNLPLLNFKGLKLIKQLFSDKAKLQVTNVAPKPDVIPLQWRPNGYFEKRLIDLRESLWNKKINTVIKKYHIEEFDIIQLDGGLGFFRDGRIINSLKEKGKTIISCYTGSDLRVRGVIPQIDAITDLNVTDEFDHLQLHPNIHHVFFPLNLKKFKPVEFSHHNILKIGHAPTSRKAKGSDIIIPLVKQLENNYSVKLVLIENLPYNDAIELKSKCDIFIDQIGDLGYGINSLESLAMGIPTCSCLAPNFAEKYPDHPFIVIDAHNLQQRLIKLIEDKELRQEKGKQGRQWVAKYHDAQKVVKKIHRLAGFG